MSFRGMIWNWMMKIYRLDVIKKHREIEPVEGLLHDSAHQMKYINFYEFS